MPRTVSAQANRDYLILLSGQIVSDFGTSVSHIAYPLLFLSITGSAVQAGLSIALTTLPTFLFGFVAGAVIDRFDRKQVMIICDIVRFMVMGSIPVLAYFNLLSIGYLYVMAFLNGVCDVFFSVTEQTAITRVAKKENLTKALGQYEASANTASLLGPALGGFLYQMGRSLPFVVDAFSYALSAISLLFVKTKFQDDTSVKPAQFSVSDMMRGAVWLWQHPLIRPISVVRSIGAIVSGGQSLLLILLAQQFSNNTTVTGLVFSIGAIGMVVGGLVSDVVMKRYGVFRSLIATRWIIAGAFLLQLLARDSISLGLAAALSYGMIAVYGTIATSYRLRLVPDELQGRVNSFHRMLAFGGLTLGGAITGLLVEYLSLTSTMLICAGLLAALALILTAILYPQRAALTGITHVGEAQEI